jgi:uncharacterized protein YjiS (DUF1127 family)
MTIETSIPHGMAAIWRFPAAVAGVLRFVRVILRSHRAASELNELSDHYLRDIGVDRPQISEVVKREAARNFLLETGWPRQSRRR